jgi:hypothetical protein
MNPRDVPPVPADDYYLRKRRRRKIVLGVVVVLGLAGLALFNQVNRRQIPVDYANDADHFKYGSIGSDVKDAIPYWIWRVMPDVCPDKLPGGYPSLGVVLEPGMDRPIGFSKRRTGLFDSVGPNCALCHTATVRESPASSRLVYLGAPAHQLNLWGYFNFLFQCGSDPRFTADNVLAAIRTQTAVGPLDAFVYRRAVSELRTALLQRSRSFDWISKRPPWGPGRVDTFNPYKTLLFNVDMSRDDSIGTADFMAIWNQGSMDGLFMHWDGNNRSVDERNLSAAMGAGAKPDTLDFKRIDRIRGWIWTLPPPAYPFEIDYDRAARGRQVYWGKGQCAGCHELKGEAIGQVVPLKYLGTDVERSRAFDDAMAARMNTIGKGYPWQFKQFRVTNGYVNHPLDGIWLRAPYLHNGSVPTLRHLLEPPDRRPEVFYKGNDVYDKANVGFVSNQTGSMGVAFFEFDTKLRGNQSTGHLYGVGLTKEEKDALVEYMKTL